MKYPNIVRSIRLLMPWAVLGAAISIYLVLVLNRPWTLWPHANHDDALYVNIAASLLEGDWLGPYNDRTLAKPPGFPFFIYAASSLGIPFHIAIALFQVGATSIFCRGLYGITKSKSAVVTAFAFILLSPQFFLLGRVLRETIYPFQVILLLGLLLLWWRSRGSTFLPLAAGLTCGWVWITREDGIWLVPGLVLFFFVTPQSWTARLGRASAFVAAGLIIPLLLGALNLSHYGRWAVSEMKDATFVAAMSATQSVSDGGRISGVAVTRQARVKIYEVSPTFAKLRPVLEAPDYFNFLCPTKPSVCGEIANGWWHWAVRLAAWDLGYHSTPTETAAFYRNVSAEISAACTNGRLSCDWRPIAALPTLGWREVLKMPGYALQITSTALMINRPYLDIQASRGAAQAIELMFAVLQRPPAFQSDQYKPSFLADPKAASGSRVFEILRGMIVAYQILYLGLLGFVVLTLAIVIILRRPLVFDSVARIILFLAALALSRIALLSIIGVTSFATRDAAYMGPIYHIFPAILILAAHYNLTRILAHTGSPPGHQTDQEKGAL